MLNAIAVEVEAVAAEGGRWKAEGGKRKAEGGRRKAMFAVAMTTLVRLTSSLVLAKKKQCCV